MTERPDLFAAVIDGVGWSNPAALRRRAGRLRRGTRMGRRSRGVRLPALKSDRQLSGGEGRHALPGGAADHRRHRSARRAVPRRQDDRAAAGGDQLAASRSCCASTSTPATASARPARSRTARRPTPTRSCSGRPACTTMDGNAMDSKMLTDFATRYTAAWCSHNAASVAAFFGEHGSLKINDAAPAVWRDEQPPRPPRAS